MEIHQKVDIKQSVLLRRKLGTLSSFKRKPKCETFWNWTLFRWL